MTVSFGLPQLDSLILFDMQTGFSCSFFLLLVLSEFILFFCQFFTDYLTTISSWPCDGRRLDINRCMYVCMYA